MCQMTGQINPEFQSPKSLDYVHAIVKKKEVIFYSDFGIEYLWFWDKFVGRKGAISKTNMSYKFNM